jgi:hypothetical protein
MVRKKRTEITVETEQVTVIHRPRSFARAWCVHCRKEVNMVTAEQAAAVAGASLRSICRFVEVDDLHFMEKADRVLFICLDSLTALTAKTIY